MSKSKRSADAHKAKKTPKQKKAWDLPDPLPRGDETVEPLYQAVGRALSAWEHLENGLAELFSVFAGSGAGGPRPRIPPAMRAYGAIIGFTSRAAMLDAAANAFFKTHPIEGHMEDWSTLHDRIIGFAVRRNDIAHGRAEILYNVEKEIEQGWYLIPGLYASKKYKEGEPPAYQLTSAQVNRLTESFTHLGARLSFFHFALSTKRRTPPHKPREPETQP